MQEQAEGVYDPPYVFVNGVVDNGPNPTTTILTPLPLPADATPGCAVYSLSSPSCANINGCGVNSSDTACAAATKAGTNVCLCVAQDTCQAFPSSVNVGDVTISGIAVPDAGTTLQLTNTGNSYSGLVTPSVYPGFAEGDTITVSATGGDYEPFAISAKGFAPLNQTHTDMTIYKDTSGSAPYPYKSLTLEWIPPDLDASVATRIQVKVDLSRHGGEIGYILCDVEDTGSITISPGLTSQVVALGSIGGFAELTVTRHTSGSDTTAPWMECCNATPSAPGAFAFDIFSPIERFFTVEGYPASCYANSDCPSSTPTCDTTKKLCN